MTENPSMRVASSSEHLSPDNQQGVRADWREELLSNLEKRGLRYRGGIDVWRVVVDFFDSSPALAQSPANRGETALSMRDMLRSVCKAGGDLGCSCADQNYQWFGGHCRHLMVETVRQFLASAPNTPESAGTKSEGKPFGYLFQPHGATVWDFSETRPDISQGAYWTVVPVYKHPSPAFPGAGVREMVAGIIASTCLGHAFDSLYADKREWLDDRGKRHDVNVPYKADVLEAADAILSALSDRAGAEKL